MEGERKQRRKGRRRWRKERVSGNGKVKSERGRRKREGMMGWRNSISSILHHGSVTDCTSFG